MTKCMSELINLNELVGTCCCFLATSSTVYPIVTHTSIRPIAKHWISTVCRTSAYVGIILSWAHQFNIRTWIIIGILFGHVHQHLHYTPWWIRSIRYGALTLREDQIVVIDGTGGRCCVGEQIVSEISKFSLYGVIGQCDANVVVARMIDCLIPRNSDSWAYCEYAPEILR